MTTNQPSSSSGTSTAIRPVMEDQIRDYKKSQRLMYVMNRRLKPPPGYRRTLESQLKPSEELQLSHRKRANLLPAEVLYDSSWSSTNHKVYQHYSEERILCVGDGNQIDMRFINQDSYDKLRQGGMQHIHLGLLMIRVQALHRKNAGTTVLLVLRDTRWSDDRSILGTMEVDMTSGVQLVYIGPDLMMGIHDFYNHVQLSIQTHGYNEWIGGESNLLITKALVGRLTNSSHAGFSYCIPDVADYLATSGIKAIQGKPKTIQQLQGQRWILKPTEQQELAHKPAKVDTRLLLNNSISLKFAEYTPVNQQALDPTEPEEELALAMRSTKKKDDKKPSDEVWDTLGQPSGKFDYYVKYTAPPETPWPTNPTGWDPDPDPDATESSSSSTTEPTPRSYKWSPDPALARFEQAIANRMYQEEKIKWRQREERKRNWAKQKQKQQEITKYIEEITEPTEKVSAVNTSDMILHTYINPSPEEDDEFYQPASPTVEHTPIPIGGIITDAEFDEILTEHFPQNWGGETDWPPPPPPNPDPNPDPSGPPEWPPVPDLPLVVEQNSWETILEALPQIQQSPPAEPPVQDYIRDKMLHWQATIMGPSAGSPYEDGRIFHLDVQFPEEYPYNRPQWRSAHLARMQCSNSRGPRRDHFPGLRCKDWQGMKDKLTTVINSEVGDVLAA